MDRLMTENRPGKDYSICGNVVCASTKLWGEIVSQINVTETQLWGQKMYLYIIPSVNCRMD